MKLQQMQQLQVGESEPDMLRGSSVEENRSGDETPNLQHDAVGGRPPVGVHSGRRLGGSSGSAARWLRTRFTCARAPSFRSSRHMFHFAYFRCILLSKVYA